MAFLGTAAGGGGGAAAGAARRAATWWAARCCASRSGACYDGLRGVDSLIWALIFVSAVGMGPFAGILALAVPDIGTLAKLFSEALEGADRRQVEAVRAAGAGRLLAVRFGLLPQVAPVMLAQLLYTLRMQHAVRHASSAWSARAGSAWRCPTASASTTGTRPPSSC